MPRLLFFLWWALVELCVYSHLFVLSRFQAPHMDRCFPFHFFRVGVGGWEISGLVCSPFSCTRLSWASTDYMALLWLYYAHSTFLYVIFIFLLCSPFFSLIFSLLFFMTSTFISLIYFFIFSFLFLSPHFSSWLSFLTICFEFIGLTSEGRRLQNWRCCLFFPLLESPIAFLELVSREHNARCRMKLKSIHHYRSLHSIRSRTVDIICQSRLLWFN